ncbi:MAG: GAF domain-containing protein [Flavobacteriaceae bacterium]
MNEKAPSLRNSTSVAGNSSIYSEELKGFLKTALKESQAEEGGLLTRDPRTGELRVDEYVGYGLEKKRRTLPSNPESGLCAAAAANCKPTYNPCISASEMPYAPLSDSRVESEFAVPIIYGGECVGVLNLESPRREAFSEEQRNSIVIYANEIAARFQVVRLSRSESFLRSQLDSVADILSSLPQIVDQKSADNENIENDLDKVLQLVLQHSLRLADAETGGILLFNNDQSALELRVAENLEPNISSSVIIPRSSKGIVWLCFEGDKPESVNIWDVFDPEYSGKFLS